MAHTYDHTSTVHVQKLSNSQEGDGRGGKWHVVCQERRSELSSAYVSTVNQIMHCNLQLEKAPAVFHSRVPSHHTERWRQSESIFSYHQSTQSWSEHGHLPSASCWVISFVLWYLVITELPAEESIVIVLIMMLRTCINEWHLVVKVQRTIRATVENKNKKTKM